MIKKISTIILQCGIILSFSLSGTIVANAQSLADRMDDAEKLIEELQQKSASLKKDFDAYTALVGKSLLVSNSSFSGKSKPFFDVTRVYFNSLLSIDPSNSEVKAPYGGSYLATSTLRVCTSNSEGHISTAIVHEGKTLNNSSNKAKNCGTAVAAAMVEAKEGDIISASCSINQTGISGQCSMSLVYLGGKKPTS